MFIRDLAHVLKRYARFPVVALLGPRQSGKKTLVREVFPDHVFVSLDREVDRVFAQEDPEGFLQTHENKHGIILDEFQYAPKITTYIKLEADKKKRPGYFVLTGSQNFLANAAVSESLAGRVGILNLLPLSIKELFENNLMRPDQLHELIFTGGYPRIYAEDIAPTDFYPSYILSCVQRDISQLVHVKDVSAFRRFIQLCAGRIGQLCNFSALAAEAGISAPTAREWLSLLESSYIIFLLEPHFKNFNKRLTKSPKLYFFDTGLACSLLRIDSPDVLANSHFYGSLFESLIISDVYKQYCNLGQRPSLYFWRDLGGAREIDCILDHGANLYPIEIKSGRKVPCDAFRNLDFWNELSGSSPKNSYLIYADQGKQIRKQATVLGWNDAARLIETIE